MIIYLSLSVQLVVWAILVAWLVARNAKAATFLTILPLKDLILWNYQASFAVKCLLLGRYHVLVIDFYHSYETIKRKKKFVTYVLLLPQDIFFVKIYIFYDWEFNAIFHFTIQAEHTSIQLVQWGYPFFVLFLIWSPIK